MIKIKTPKRWHTDPKLARTEITSKGTVLMKQTAKSQHIPIKRLCASSASDLVMLSQIWGQHFVNMRLSIREYNASRCPLDWERVRYWCLWDACCEASSPQRVHKKQQPCWQTRNFPLFVYQSGFDIPQWQPLCVSVLLYMGAY